MRIPSDKRRCWCNIATRNLASLLLAVLATLWLRGGGAAAAIAFVFRTRVCHNLLRIALAPQPLKPLRAAFDEFQVVLFQWNEALFVASAGLALLVRRVFVILGRVQCGVYDTQQRRLTSSPATRKPSASN